MCAFCCTFENCNKKFNRPSRLDSHIRVHLGERPFVCNIDWCDKAYSRNQDLIRHQAGFHNCPDKPRHDCDSCDKYFVSKQGLSRHVLRYHTGGVFKCPHMDCDAEFSKKRHLSAHVATHTGEEYVYRCENQMCGKEFSTFAKLDRHRKLHCVRTCEYCNEEFYTWKEYIKHKKLHKPKRFDCEECKRIFKSKRSLDKHTKEMCSLFETSGPRVTFECTVGECRKRYTTKSNLKAHVDRCHNGVRYPCVLSHICSEKFSSKQKMEEHWSRVHSDSGVANACQEESCNI